MIFRPRYSLLVNQRTVFSVCGVLLSLHGPACKRNESSFTPAAGSAALNPLPESSRLRVFLTGCGFAGWSMIEGRTFLHLVASDALQENSNDRVLAVPVAPDGRIDLAASTLGARVYGEWPGSAWLQTSSNTGAATSKFSRWNGSAWVEDPQMSPSVTTLLPWRDKTMLRVERRVPHGTRLVVHASAQQTAKLRVPPELERFEPASVFGLPKAGIAVMTGAVDGQIGYTIVAGTTTAVLRNSVGTSVATASESCDRILLSQWVNTADNSEPRPRTVRIGAGGITTGEQLPAEPAHFAIDQNCHEWFISAEGALFEKQSTSTGWARRNAGRGETQPPSTIVAVGSRIWAAIGPTLDVLYDGQSERVDLPFSLGTQGAAMFLASDQQGDRLWAAVIPTNEKRGTILTTGPAPQKMRCDQLAEKIGVR
jgi:hypothetical protein